MLEVINGVKNVSKKFQIQFPAVAKEAEWERTLIGKISPIATQTPGPQVDAKPKMNMQAEKIRREPVVVEFGLACEPTAANTMSQAACQMPPRMSGVLRP